jgi:hypothetical protein
VLGFGVAKFRQVFTAKPTPGTGLSPGQDVYLCAEVIPQNPSLNSPLGGANCVHWSLKVWAVNANSRGSSSSIVHQESEGQEFFIRSESGPIRVRFGLQYLPSISVEAVELTQNFVTYSDQQHIGKKFSYATSEEYVRRHNIVTKQMGVIPKSLTLEEKSICPGQALHIWGKISENSEEMPTLEATMISAKGASFHWLHGSIAVLASIFLLYVGSGLILACLQGF